MVSYCCRGVLAPMYKQLNVEALFIPQDKNNHRSTTHRGNYLYCLSLSTILLMCACDMYTTHREAIAAIAFGPALHALRATVGSSCFKMIPILITKRRYFKLLYFIYFIFQIHCAYIFFNIFN